MAPAKNKSRAAAAASDYETDFPSQNSLANLAPPPHRTNEELNLAVLRRHYPDLLSIVSIASFCVVYAFSPETQAWEKYGVDGTLFINQLMPSDDGIARCSVIVFNRRSMEKFSVELKSADDVELTDDYVILQSQHEDGSLQIFGLWIFTEPHPSSTARAREINAEIIKQCAALVDNSRRTLEAMNNGSSSEPDEPESVPMGRQLSLRELFGKQREADAGFSIHHHETPTIQAASTLPTIPSHPRPQAQAAQPAVQQSMASSANAPTPRFTNTPDTDFFLSAPKVTPASQTQGQRKARGHPTRHQQPKEASPVAAQYTADYASMDRTEFFNVFNKTRAEGWSVINTPFGSFSVGNYMLAQDAFLGYKNNLQADKVESENRKITFESTFTPTVGGRKMISQKVVSKSVTKL
ncbi:decapping enzyme dcp1 [Diplodia corticola]|uniref:Decapping enzyme dcp1 n=1 Tax=Diplodia corticola TaxID=236234 RepID=A0A1J9QSZ7_9PEZI|nr:decapping enzyme dcp1 [Diplodia corticola]OJD31568.1 decapping enzyme dcp1 [Diplodia corticola]